MESLILPYFADDPGIRQYQTAVAEEAIGRASGAFHEDESPDLARLSLWFLEGKWAEARDMIEAIRSTNSMTNHRLLANWTLMLLARHQCETQLAWSLVAEAMPLREKTAPGNVRYTDAQHVQQVAASLAMDEGDLATAHAWLQTHDRWLQWSGDIRGLAH